LSWTCAPENCAKKDEKFRLQAQPFQFLALLVENPGEVVTREEVCRALWPEKTFVDFDHGLAVAVNKIREALNDSAENARFIETLPKRGYRFIAPVREVLVPQKANGAGANGTPEATPAAEITVPQPSHPEVRQRHPLCADGSLPESPQR
jgi:cholera toxin transcriptional activator